jgi:hypothetical protein
MKEACQPRARAGRASARRERKFGGIEASQISHGHKGAVSGIQSSEGVP